MKSLFKKSITNNPVLWTKELVGTKLRFTSTLGIHLILCTVIGVILYNENISYLISVVVIVGLWLPLLYLYALRKLLIMADNTNTEKKPTESIS